MKYFAHPATIQRLSNSELDMVFLVGGFTGFLNFGDVVQLQGAIRWHQGCAPAPLLCAFIHPRSVVKGIQLSELSSLFNMEDWIFFSYPGEEQETFLELFDQDIKPFTLDWIQSPVKVHFYGSGRLNRYWGTRTLKLLDDLLGKVSRKYYLISGQQVSLDFVEAFVDHLQVQKPTLIGCRDQSSLRALGAHNQKAHYSGDDSLEVLRLDRGEAAHGSKKKNGWGFNYRVTTFAGNMPDMIGDAKDKNSSLQVFKDMVSGLAVSGKMFNLESFGYPERQAVDIERVPALKKWYLEAETLNLVEAMMENRLSEVVRVMMNLRFAVVMSYHLALFLYILEVPVYLLSYNDYYRQKREGIDQGQESLGDFLTQRSRMGWLSRQNCWLEDALLKRERWLNEHLKCLSGKG